MSPRLRDLLLTSTALLALGSVSGTAGPEGPQVVGGTAAVTGAGTASVVVNQSSNRAIINWNTFNIGSGETTTFNQPASSSVALNRVTGGLGPSQIYGTLNANGQVFVINRDGVLVGSTGVINTAGFLASTNDINNAHFMAGQYRFNIPGRADASIVNLGSITASSGGFAALVAPGVRNSGTITATLGTVSLAAGNSFTLDLYGDKLIQLAPSDSIASQVIDVATGKPLTSLVSNTGKLSANGGRVELTAAAARAVVDSVINTSGVIEANAVGTRDGRIVLGAATAATKPAETPTQAVKVSGTLSAAGKEKGTKGGTVVVTGENIQVTGAKIDVSGDVGGGKVMLGGDWSGGNPLSGLVNNQSATLESYQIATASTLNVDAATTIDASAKNEGHGGKVILWSDNQTTFAGTIFARGGDAAGNGGFVEVSGKEQLSFTGTVDTLASNGLAGTLLLDPANITISAAASTGGFAPTTNDSVINATTLESALAANNVIVLTTAGGTQEGNITVAAPLNWLKATTLTLQANKNIAINSAITATSGGLTLNAGNAITAPAAINLATFTLQKGAWTQVSTTLPTFAAKDFRLTGGSFLRASGGDGGTDSPYQIADVYGLQGIGSSANLLGKNYVLANSIDASGTANWNGGAGFTPIGNLISSFSGVFDGLNHSINGLTIASASANVGLFGVNRGKIQNVGVTNVAIIALGSSQFVGAVAGNNIGTIANTYSSGSISNPAGESIEFALGAYGGLVGLNDSKGRVSQSYSTVAIDLTGPEAGYLDAGGLVGQNKGSISESYASGSISGKYSSSSMTYLGGLVGWNLGGSIERAYATGSVTGDGKYGRLGGLVGLSDGGSITQTYASGAIKMTGTHSIAGGLVAASTATITSSYWDMGTTGLATSAGGTGLTTEQARHQSSYVGFDFTNTWFMIDGQTRPFLRSEYSTTINNAHQLQLVAMHLGASYTLGGNINLAAELANPSNMWGSQGFAPIGSISAPFTGQLDGQNQTIDGLKIAPTNFATNNIGLFAAIGSGGSVSNLNLTNANITVNSNTEVSGQFVGVLAGSNAGTISNVHVTNSTINGIPLSDGQPAHLAGVTAGGLVGQNGILGPQNQPMAGAIINSSASDVTVTVGNGCFGECWGGFNIAGGLVGSNAFGSTITGSQASGIVTGGEASFVGGLVGQNGIFGFSTGSISSSFANVAVSITGLYSAAGGLAGSNAEGSTITNSQAVGNVTSTANGTGNQEFTSAGGLVGQNAGTITSTTQPMLGSPCALGSSFSCATGNVSVGSAGTGGGLVGNNQGTIEKSFAIGAVTGAAGYSDGEGGDRSTQLGGLAGSNQGTITDSFATGSVGTLNVAWLGVGGLVGDNSGIIERSFATGAVSAGNHAVAGGLVGSSTINECDCLENQGTGANNSATIINSWASGNVTVGHTSVAGGLAGVGATFTNTSASGNVTGEHGSVLGGLLGAFGFDGGSLTGSTASGNVTGTGANNIIGGLVGLNAGTINSTSSSTGHVTGDSESYIGGLVGLNLGRIDGVQSTATATVEGLGNLNVVGGLVGGNVGTIIASAAQRNVSGGTNAAVGGLAGANLTFSNISSEFTIAGSSFPIGTISNSSASGAVSGGAGSFVGGLVGINGGSILNSTASGNATGGTNSTVGGLVGRNAGPLVALGLPAIIASCDASECGELLAATVSSGAGSITDSSATGAVNGGAGATVGGLVGFNPGTITNAYATGAVTLTLTEATNAAAALTVTLAEATNAIAGGLVGMNEGEITNSHATGAVSSTGGQFVSLGGLVGNNDGSVGNSYATGNISATGVTMAALGGLVGQNYSTITNSHATGAVSGSGMVAIGGLVGDNSGTIAQSYATGAVSSTGDNNIVSLGGLVGTNDGSIGNSYATGNVSATGAAAASVGGLVGRSQTTVTNSYATGAVSSSGGTFASLGGLVGTNDGSIGNSHATGNISATGTTWANLGGFAGTNFGTITQSNAAGNVSAEAATTLAGGFAGMNTGTIELSYATGNVSGGPASMLGGFVGQNYGTITESHATGNVASNAETAYAGGFAGWNGGRVNLSYATGNVSGGPESTLGGFVGLNSGSINQAYARGAVTGGDGSFIGGFVGVNIPVLDGEGGTSGGSITQSYALGPVTGSNEVVAAAFAALNLGSLNETYGAGLVTAGTGSTTGGLVAANTSSLLSTTISGTNGGTTVSPILPNGTATNSYWDRQTTGQETSAGGVAMDTAVLAGAVPAGFDPTIWTHGSYPQLVNLGPQETTPGPAVLPPLQTNEPLPPAPPSSLLLVNTNPIGPPPAPPELFTIQNLTQQLQQTQPVPQVASINNPIQLNVGANRYFFIPPPEETRLVANEVVIQLPCNAPRQTLDAALAEMQLSVLNSQCLATTNVAVYRLQTSSGQALASVIRGLANHRIVASAQANYLYTLSQTLSQTPSSLGQQPVEQRGDSGQYVLEKLRLSDIHRRVRSNAVPIAVIDSEIDGAHPDLAGVNITRYDATGDEEKPHSHGTGMAGAIASNHRLLGTAPGAPLFAIRAFSSGKNASAESTTFNILRGLDYAVNNNVRIVNMSFAGPRDPTLERAIKQAHDKGVIMIAAAGNMGPKSPPLYPAADKHVIAVTATDIDDLLFTGATRGKHIAVSAPGVDILVPAPEGTYQMTTGTSVATAHVSGIVALMLERNPRLTPADVRRILTASAKRLGANDQFGAGLIDPTKALQLAAPRTVEAPILSPPPATIPARR